MDYNIQRRHNRWYEALIFFPGFNFLVGFIFVVFIPAWFRWEFEVFAMDWGGVILTTNLANTLAFSIAYISFRRIRRFPGAQTLSYILPAIAIAWCVVVFMLFFSRAEYSRQVIFTSYFLANILFVLAFFIVRRYRLPKLALVPFGRYRELEDVDNASVHVLLKPDLDGRRFDAVVADLHSDDLLPEWESFLARCTLARIPVYHVKNISESLTGRVQINHLSENEFGALLPSAYYGFVKRCLEVFLVITSSPIWLPVILITGLLIKIDSPGGVFFIQNRVGQGGKPFRLYKLRSMCINSEENGAMFATENDMRVTKIGRFIRKTRIDEFPQFINILLGHMSLIGPRPEQISFVKQFEDEIPFYSYRHVVKPGITGWAQVVHGYAADADDTRIKIQHDFYYIKNFSLWLDILIIFKTIRTIFTGFGAR